MKKPPRYLSFGSILVSLLLLNACQHIQPQQPQPDSTPAVENVPTNLLRTTVVDSLITLSEPIDFSSVSRTGQGPSGRLIRWGNIESPGYWRSFTYDPTGRLMGIFQEEYGTRHTELAHYQGAYLAESLIQDATEGEGRVYTIKRYKYDTQGRLSQTLIYASSNDEPKTFRLYTWLLHEYDAQGQLQKSRRQSVNPASFYDVFYWQKGDCVRQEQYFIAGSGKPDELRERTDNYFGSQTNPLSGLPLYDEYTTQPSTHYITSSLSHEIRDGVSKSYPGCTFTSAFEYDGQGRLSRMRYSVGNAWDYFTYAQ